ARLSLRSVPSGVMARKVDGSGSASAPTSRSSAPGRIRMTPRPGPDSSATSSATKRSILPFAVAVTTAGPLVGSTGPPRAPPPAHGEPPAGTGGLGKVRRAAEAVPLLGGDEERRRRLAAQTRERLLTWNGLRLADQPRRHDALAVAELEKRLHRLAVP